MFRLKGGSAPLRRLAVTVTVALAAGGCAGVAEVAGTATQNDLMQLRADVTRVQLDLQRVRSDSERHAAGVDARLREDSGQSARQSQDIARRLEALTTTLTTLSARVDDLATRVDSLTRRVTAAPAPAPSRPPVAATPPTPTPAPTPPVPAPAPAAPPLPQVGARPSTGALQPQDVYQAAYIDFSKGSYALAIAGFREFLRRYPDHELADNAQYWIGEAHFSVARTHANAGQSDKATQELERAVQEFRKVVANYPRGDKAPTALYKEALALVELKEPALAQARLQYLIENFPQAEETPLARERLTSLKGS